jgi:endonuclease YncB( thermonuclease family)
VAELTVPPPGLNRNQFRGCYRPAPVMKFTPTLLATLLVASSLALLTVAPATAQVALMPASVVRVVDGDTVDVQLGDGQTERIRLIGIDTPEIVDPRSPVQCFAREASVHAHELLDGQAVSLELDASQGERDRYGRMLGYLWLPDGRNFGEVMIADGFAHEYTYDQPYAYLDTFRAAQDSAIAQHAGLWSPAACAGDTTRPADSVPVTDTPAPSPPALLAPAPPAAAYAGPYDPFGPDRDCADFRTHAEAQAFFIAAGGPRSDRHRLDADHDGLACETLP